MSKKFIIKKWQKKYLNEGATTKDALTLAKLVQKVYSNKRYYKTKVSKKGDDINVNIIFRNEDGDKSQVVFSFQPAGYSGAGEVILSDSEGASIEDYLDTSSDVTFDIFKKQGPHAMDFWRSDAPDAGVVQPLKEDKMSKKFIINKKEDKMNKRFNIKEWQEKYLTEAANGWDKMPNNGDDTTGSYRAKMMQIDPSKLLKKLQNVPQYKKSGVFKDPEVIKFVTKEWGKGGSIRNEYFIQWMMAAPELNIKKQWPQYLASLDYGTGISMYDAILKYTKPADVLKNYKQEAGKEGVELIPDINYK
jgi:hypothetical protein